MATLAKLQNKAEACFCMAERTRDPDLKIAWAKLTEAWLALAEQEKRRGPQSLNWRGSHRRTGRGGHRTRPPQAA
jgi:hypothetical protein